VRRAFGPGGMLYIATPSGWRAAALVRRPARRREDPVLLAARRWQEARAGRLSIDRGPALYDAETALVAALDAAREARHAEG
jgi:hypothetical protein